MMNNKNSQNYFNRGPKNLIIGVFFLVSIITLLSLVTEYTRSVQHIPYTSFIKRVEQDDVKKIQVSGQDVVGIFKDGSRFETVIAPDNKNWDILRDHNVEINVINTTSPIGWWYIMALAGLLGLLVAYFFFRQSRNASNSGGGGNHFYYG